MSSKGQIKRYNFEVCSCGDGPHIETVEDSDGDYVRFEDVSSLLLPEKERAIPRPYTQNNNPLLGDIVAQFQDKFYSLIEDGLKGFAEKHNISNDNLREHGVCENRLLPESSMTYRYKGFKILTAKIRHEDDKAIIEISRNFR